MRILPAAQTCVLAAMAAAAFGQSAAPTLRLPDTAAPAEYHASLTLDPSKPTFTGHVRIAIRLKQGGNVIWLNGSHLSITAATLKTGGKSYPMQGAASGDDFIQLSSQAAFPAGAGELEIDYTGAVLGNGSAGIFHMEDNGNHYLYTQFEATSAREAFPCFDEPSYKVPWQLSLTVPAGNTAVSNTPIAREVKGNGTITYEFARTKPLPSYLVAFGVGPFDYVDAGKAGKRQIPVRIVAPKGHAVEASYAAQVTPEIINRLEAYFGIPFPYDKSDQLAIPMTVGFGAMENPGLVTYGQTIILAKPERDTIGRQRGYAEVAAHELAHQWFGDLVTTAWWDDIWLNEAFATWMEQRLIREWKPEWKTAAEDTSSRLGAKNEDSLTSARKIRQEIQSKDDISHAFDGITYQKGAAVITMFENWVGPEAFRKGVHDYLTTYANRNATAGEFLDAISTASKRNVTAAFSSFLNQTGVPLITVSMDCAPGAVTLHLEQQRFVPRGSPVPEKQTWQVPVCIRYPDGDTLQRACELLTRASQEWVLKTKTCPAWIQANDNTLGYYNVSYQGNLLQSLAASRSVLSAPERLDLIGSAAALHRAGKMPMSRVLELAELLATDPERQVVEHALGEASYPAQQLVPPERMPNYRRFLLKNFQARARELGWSPKPGESDEVRLLRRSMVPTIATWGGDAQLAAEARTLAERWLADHAALDPNIAGAALSAAAFGGDKAFFDKLLANLQVTKDRQDRARILRALGGFRDRDAVAAGFRSLLDGQIPFMEGIGLLFAGQAAPETRGMSLEFIQSHFDEILAKRPLGGAFDIAGQLPWAGASYCDAGHKQALRDFFEPRLDKMPGSRRTMAQVLEVIDTCIAQRADDEASVAEFLKKY